jgi:hypothetical protein
MKLTRFAASSSGSLPDLCSSSAQSELQRWSGRLLSWRAVGLLLGHGGLRSVATARMPDHDLVAAPFVERYFTTGPASIVSPIVTLPIVSVLVETVWSDAEARDFGFGRDGIPS